MRYLLIVFFGWLIIRTAMAGADAVVANTPGAGAFTYWQIIAFEFVVFGLTQYGVSKIGRRR